MPYAHYQGSPIREVGGRKRGTPKATVATAELAEILARRPDLKGKSIEAVRRILRRETRLSLRPLTTYAAIRGMALRLRPKRRWRSWTEAGARTGGNCLPDPAQDQPQ